MKASRFLRVLPLALMLLSAPARAEQGTIVGPIVGPHTMADVMGTINASMLAIQSCNSGSSAPANGVGAAATHYQCWADTTTNPVVFKQYDGASWVSTGSLNTSTHAWLPYLTGGVSGGIPYFSTTGIMGSSALLTQFGPVYGGGAGAAPVSMAVGTNGQLIVGQSAAAPLWKTISGDVTISAAGVMTIGATKVTSAMLNADVFSTAHSWAGQQTFVAPILGVATGTSLALGGATIGTNALAATGSVAISSALSNGGTGHTITSTGGNCFAVGANGTTTPALNVDCSTASQAAGLNVKGAVSGGIVAISTNGSGSLSIDATGSGTINIGNTSTGNITIGHALNYGSVTLSNAVTGTGAMVLGNSPTLVAPALGTPASAILTNALGLPVSGLSAQGAYTLICNNSVSSAIPTACDITAFTSKPAPVSADIVLIQDSAASNSYKRTTVGALSSAGSVASIGGLTGAVGVANGIEVSGSNIQIAAARRTLPTIQKLTSGSSATYTTPANVLWLEVKMCGAGAGGTGGGGSPGGGGPGGSTIFGLHTATGGAAASGGANPGGAGGSGGTIGAGAIGREQVGGAGVGAASAVTGLLPLGGYGGSSLLGFGGQGGANTLGNGASAAANSCGGGGGGGANTSQNAGGGGGGGDGLDLIINSPASTYTYTIGAGGTGGTAGSNGGAGGNGGSGFGFVIEHYGT